LRGEAGFSLLEVLVAFTILALSLGLLMQSFSTSMRGLRLSEEYTKATMLAESTLAQVGISLDLKVGELRGEAADGFHWRLTVQPYVAPSGAPLTGALIPYLVEVTVSWSEAGREVRELRLSTLHLSQEDDPDAHAQGAPKHNT